MITLTQEPRVSLELRLVPPWRPVRGSQPFQPWDLGKFLDLGQLLFLICQVEVIKAHA